MLLAREGNTDAMHGVATDQVEDLGILLTCGTKGASARRNIIEKILDLGLVNSVVYSVCIRPYRYLCALTTSAGLRFSALIRFGRHGLPIGIMGFPGTAGLFGPGRDTQVGYVADTGQSFTAKSVGADSCQVFEGLQFRSRKTFTQDRQVLALRKISNGLLEFGKRQVPRCRGHCLLSEEA